MNEKRRMGTLKDYKRNSGVLGALYIRYIMTLGNSLKIHNLYMALKCPLNKASFRSTTVDAAAGPSRPLTNYGFMHFAVF